MTDESEPWRASAASKSARVAMLVTDADQPDNPIIYANDAFLKLTGYAREEVIGRNCRFLQGSDSDRAEVARISHAIQTGEDVTAEILNYRKDGSSFWNALQINPVRNDKGVITCFIASQVDVSDTHRDEPQVSDGRNDLEHMVAERTRELTQALEQKTALLHEVDHRVKNNLQLISSLLLLQNRRVTDPAVKHALRGMLERVGAIATVHRRLFQSDDIERFDVSAFIRDLVADLMGTAGRNDIAFELDLERVEVPAAKAAPLALVANELLSNALRHAFPVGQAGRILIGIRRMDDTLRIEIADDGVGAGAATQSSGFGLTIVQLLCQQLKAKAETTDASPGTRVVITLPVNGAPH